jgi:hypothetical protein
VNSPVRPNTGIELALIEQWRTAPITQDRVQAGLKLGLFYLQEHRYTDADAMFKEMEREQGRPNILLPETGLPVQPALLGKLGQAVVLSMQDQTPESNMMFEEALNSMPRPLIRTAMERLCFEYAEFGQAISEAANRNADNMPKGAKLSPLVQWLTTPAALIRGPK